MIVLVRRLLTLGVLFFCLSAPALAETGRRVALVIGNGAYRHIGPLANPVNDATAMVAALRQAGFDTGEVRTDLDLAGFKRALEDFQLRARGADVAIVYYSGHGLEFGGQNYLVPVDAAIEQEVAVEDETVSLSRVLKAVAGARKLKLVILDACRKDPFEATSRDRAVDRGFVRVEPSEVNELIAYAAKAGTVALDGADGADHSPYTAALLKRLTEPGLDVERALRRVHDDVLAATDHKQEPYFYGALGGEDMPLMARPAGPTDQAVPVLPPSSADVEGQAFATAMRRHDLAGLDAFLTLYPTSSFVDIVRDERKRLAALQPSPVARACNGVTQASLRERAVGPLTPDEVCALQPKDEFKECAHCPTMVLVPSGSFTMGSPKSEAGRYDDEGRQHKVTFAAPFAVGKFAVTFDEWDACVEGGGCGGYRPADQGWGRGMRPVINVSWDDAQTYLQWLKAKTGREYRLLSESEWEYAARGNTTTAYWWGDGITHQQANYGGNQTLPVDSFKPNPFGLYNMLGNVWQWVQDCYQESYTGAPDDGSALTINSCKRRVLRGGSWDDDPRGLRAASRGWLNPVSRYNVSGFGFRVGVALPRTQ